jgi:hypothetical protein
MPDPALPLRSYQLADNLGAQEGAVFLTGTQALVRLLLLQKRRDEAAGLRTAGFVSGYRGSPLGMVDQQLWKAGKFLQAAQVEFLPAINEDLAATAVLGTQRVALDPERGSRACLPCGTARGRAWTAAATPSSTATSTVRARRAACWWSAATTTAASPAPCRTRATWRCRLALPGAAPGQCGRVPGVRPLRLGR